LKRGHTNNDLQANFQNISEIPDQILHGVP